MTEHTPGPWRIRRAKIINTPEEESAEPIVIADVYHHSYENREANSALIAAAPELLDALQNICAGKLDADEMKEIARAALSKARVQP